MRPQVLGVDIGGVIIDRINDGTDTSFFSDNYLNTTAVPGAFEVLARLVKERFGDRVHLVSKSSRTIQCKSVKWLVNTRFHSITGISESNVHFCFQRWEKAPICQRLGVTHFVDDRLEVLGRLTTVEHRFLFQPRGHEVRMHAQHLKSVCRVESWKEIERELLG